MPEPITDVSTGWIIVEQWEDDPDIGTWVTLFNTYERAANAVKGYIAENEFEGDVEWNEDADGTYAFVAISDVASWTIQKVTRTITVIGEDEDDG